MPLPTEAEPTLAEIGALVWARTVDEEGDTSGTFTDDTQPSLAQVQELIRQAGEDVLAVCVQGAIPAGSEGAARRAIATRVAYLIEISYFPEQNTGGTDSPYLQLKEQADRALTTFVTAAQMRDMFGTEKADSGSGSGT